MRPLLLLAALVLAAPALADPLCPATPGDRALPDLGGYAGNGDLVWTGDGWLAAWSERGTGQDKRSHLYVAKLTPKGELVKGSRQRLFDDSGIQRYTPRLSVAGDVVGMVYTRIDPADAGTLELGQPDLAPPPRDAPDRPTKAARAPPRKPGTMQRKTPPPLPQRDRVPQTITYQIPLTWFTVLDMSGRRVAPEHRVTPKGRRGGDHATVAWDAAAKRWGLLYSTANPPGGNTRVFFRHVGRKGLRGKAIALSQGVANLGDGVTLVGRPGGGFVAVWNEIRGLMLAELGKTVEREVVVSREGGTNPTVATAGPWHAVAWRVAPLPGQVRVARVRDGAVVEGTDHVLGTPKYHAGNPSVRIEGEQLHVLWVQHTLEQDGRPAIAEASLEAPEAKPSTMHLRTRVPGNAGWPRWVDGPCPGSLTYVHFGTSGENRWVVPPGARDR